MSHAGFSHPVGSAIGLDQQTAHPLGPALPQLVEPMDVVHARSANVNRSTQHRYSPHSLALLEGQVWAWHTVIWGFTFSLVFGAGFRPYRWVGQKTPGTWDDVD